MNYLASLIGAMQSGESFLGLLTSVDTGRATIRSAAYGSVNSPSCSAETGPGAIHCLARPPVMIAGILL
jgi:hypothetical protein